jgi:hypothetical protein
MDSGPTLYGFWSYVVVSRYVRDLDFMAIPLHSIATAEHSGVLHSHYGRHPTRAISDVKERGASACRDSAANRVVVPERDELDGAGHPDGARL